MYAMVASLRQSISGKWYVTLECACCMSNSGVGDVPGRLSSVGLCARVMYENRGVNALVCLFCYIFNFKYRFPGRIGSIFSGMSVNYVVSWTKGLRYRPNRKQSGESRGIVGYINVSSVLSSG